MEDAGGRSGAIAAAWLFAHSIYLVALMTPDARVSGMGPQQSRCHVWGSTLAGGRTGILCIHVLFVAENQGAVISGGSLFRNGQRPVTAIIACCREVRRSHLVLLRP